MSFSFDLLGLFNMVKTVYDELISRDAKTIEAMELVNEAVIDTHHYLHHQNGAYVSNPALAKQWNKAAAAVYKVNTQLGDWLKSKSDFWSYPDEYFRLQREDEILTLAEIRGEFHRLRQTLRNRG